MVWDNVLMKLDNGDAIFEHCRDAMHCVSSRKTTPNRDAMHCVSTEKQTHTLKLMEAYKNGITIMYLNNLGFLFLPNNSMFLYAQSHVLHYQMYYQALSHDLN